MGFNVRGLGGVTAPQGFVAAGVSANVKGKGGTKKDVALVYSARPATAAGVFTTNRVEAACVTVTREHVAGGYLHAIVANSGNANACTGQQGLADTRQMCVAAARALGIRPDQVGVASTGVIGVYLPMDRICAGVEACALSLGPEGNTDAAQAIMTTDTFPKEWAVQVELPSGSAITIGGMAKGSGMIHPNLATMLAFITTDAHIGPAALGEALRAAAAKSFGMITVDGDTSTNDMVLVLANGFAGNPEILPGTEAWDAFCTGLDRLCIHLARSIARDGEGATKLIEVQVAGAPSVADARKAARAVAGSSLVKSAIFGEDANWGRILAAIGYSGADFDPAQVDLYIGNLQVASGGAGLSVNEEAAHRILAQAEVVIRAELHAGEAGATAWGCDLSYDYVKINADYRT